MKISVNGKNEFDVPTIISQLADKVIPESPGDYGKDHVLFGVKFSFTEFDEEGFTSYIVEGKFGELEEMLKTLKVCTPDSYLYDKYWEDVPEGIVLLREGIDSYAGDDELLIFLGESERWQSPVVEYYGLPIEAIEAGKVMQYIRSSHSKNSEMVFNFEDMSVSGEVSCNFLRDIYHSQHYLEMRRLSNDEVTVDGIFSKDYDWEKWEVTGEVYGSKEFLDKYAVAENGSTYVEAKNLAFISRSEGYSFLFKGKWGGFFLYESRWDCLNEVTEEKAREEIAF